MSSQVMVFSNLMHHNAIFKISLDLSNKSECTLLRKFWHAKESVYSSQSTDIKEKVNDKN